MSSVVHYFLCYGENCRQGLSVTDRAGRERCPLTSVLANPAFSCARRALDLSSGASRQWPPSCPAVPLKCRSTLLKAAWKVLRHLSVTGGALRDLGTGDSCAGQAPGLQGEVAFPWEGKCHCSGTSDWGQLECFQGSCRPALKWKPLVKWSYGLLAGDTHQGQPGRCRDIPISRAS